VGLIRLPQIQEQLEQAISATQGILDGLPPPPPDNPQGEINRLLFQFIADLGKHVNGIPDEDGLMQAIRPAQERFRRAVRATAPNFRPFKRIEEAVRHIRRAEFLVLEEGDVPDDEYSEDETDEDEEESDESASEAGQAHAQAAPRGQKRKSPPNNKIYIDDVMQRANRSAFYWYLCVTLLMNRTRARTRELPGHYPFIVQTTFIENIIREWKQPALILSQMIRGSVSDLIEKLVKKHFGRFGQGVLELRIRFV